MREETFKRRLIGQAQIQAGHRVLDVGCGTGTLTILIKQLHPAAEIVGVDGDPRVLQIATVKAIQTGASIGWNYGMAFDLPYPGGSFDRVLTSLVLHHLTHQNKRRTFREVLRVLRPGGEFHIVDFGKPHTPAMRLIALVISRLEETADNLKGLLPVMLDDAGFVQAEEVAHAATIVGPLSLYRAKKSE